MLGAGQANDLMLGANIGVLSQPNMQTLTAYSPNPYLGQLMSLGPAEAMYSTIFARLGGGDMRLRIANIQQIFSTGDYNNTMKLASELIRVGGAEERGIGYHIMGACYFNLNKIDDCIVYSNIAIELNPQLEEAYYNIGNAYKKKGRLDQAKQYFHTAITIKPDFLAANLNYAYILTLLKQYHDAFRVYQNVLNLEPLLPVVHYNMALILATEGKTKEASKMYCSLADILKAGNDIQKALVYYKEACKMDNSNWKLFQQYGNSLRETGQQEAALKIFNYALDLNSQSGQLHFEIASLLEQNEEDDGALDHYKKAIQLEPNHIDSYNNLGNLYRKIKKSDLALETFELALSKKTDVPHLYNNKGNVYLDIMRRKEAMFCYERALQLSPNFAAAHCNMATCLKAENRNDEALIHSQWAIQIDPLFADAYCNMGNIFKDIGQFDDAIQFYKKAIELNPKYAAAYANIANAYKDNSRNKDAIYYYEKTLELEPNNPDAFNNYFHSLIFICDWKKRDEHLETLQKFIWKQIRGDLIPSCQPFHCFVYPLEANLKHLISKKYAERDKSLAFQGFHMQGARHKFTFDEQIGKYERIAGGSGEIIRIGYISSDFRNHPLAHLLTGIFAMHNRHRFEIIAFGLPTIDEGTEYGAKIKYDADHVVDIPNTKNILEAATCIYEHGIDILVNLNGYTKGARNEIFALQPSPIQVSLIGFPGSMGATYIQYLIADKMVIPPELTCFYTENIVYMPHSYFVNDYKQSMLELIVSSPRPTRAHFGLPDKSFIFGNFNQLYKIDPRTFDCWCNILHKVPNSIIWLLRFPREGEENIKREAESRGINRERLFFTDIAEKEIHVSRCFLADLSLDSPLCNGHTTTTDLLWSGLPIITLPLTDFPSRVASSLCSALDCPEMIVNNYEEYEALAIELAIGHPGTLPQLEHLPLHLRNINGSLKLKYLRWKVEQKRISAPLFDTQRWVRNVETAYTMMTQIYCKTPQRYAQIEVIEFQSPIEEQGTEGSGHKRQNA